MRRGIVFAALFGLPALTLAPTGAVAVPRPAPTVAVTESAPPTGQVAPQDPAAPPDPAATADPDEATATPAVTAPPDDGAAQAAAIPAEAFVDIRRVAQNRDQPRRGRNASTGSFVSQCGTNANGHHNSDNFIVAPGVVNGAHHTHDYVGNLSTDGFSTDQSLQAAGTTCRNNDRSTYFWPVLRLRNGAGDTGQDGNVGTILRPASATLRFKGNARAKVTAMPRFLRIITGNAKAVSQAGANAAAQWTCTGFQNRITQKYPLCPRGSRVARVLDFPSCWDGANVDSANHRTHVLFPDRGTGACPAGTRPIPQLRMTLTYDVPAGRGRSIALDSFPEEQHDASTDHGDFEQVMPGRLTQRIVDCVNTGRSC